MTSERKIAANRANGRKSRGPRTAAGKAIASRNAVKHGLAAMTYRDPVPTSELERFARTLCGDDSDPVLFEHALTIANNELVLRAIRAQQLAVVERLRDPSAIALARGDNSIALGEARFRKCEEAFDLAFVLRDRLLEKYKDKLPPPIVADCFSEMDELIPPHLEMFLQEQSEPEPKSSKMEGAATRSPQRVVERDNSVAMQEAALDLVRLDRYERRIWSRQKRAFQAFIEHKLMKLSTPTEKGPVQPSVH